MDNGIKEKSLAFAKRVVSAYKYLCEEKHEYVLSKQFLRSGTSIGANIREAFYAHGKADFIAKLQIALKECSETEYWIELLLESGYYSDKSLLEQHRFNSLYSRIEHLKFSSRSRSGTHIIFFNINR